MNKDLISTKTQITVVFALYLILAFFADAKGQIDRNLIKANPTNLDALFPTKGQAKAESCFVYSRGVDAIGNPLPNDSLGDLIIVYKASACQDTSEAAGQQKKQFIWQIQDVAQTQVDSINTLKSKGKKVRIMNVDLTNKQKNDIKLNKKYLESLGNFRLEVK
jgi:hypothetical protein